ncbi:MAG: ATP-binding cassette domain-containing protein, partial [Desulfocapsaceae bacterium]|nr:ATP-binding cassette domain-containing protein [Desulfocapsaceae bacterium]
MLELKNIQAGYGNVQALRDISLTIHTGEIITLIGANGAGKSTTLMAISGIVPCRSGQILLQGKEIQDLAPDRIVAMGVCQVP